MALPPRLRPVLAAGLAYVALAVLWAAPASLRPWDTLPDIGDPAHLSWVLAWDAHQIVRQPWALFDSNSFHPYPRSLAFGDHLLPEALLVAPVFWATGNAVLASNVALLIALTLSALAMFLLVRHVTGSAGVAFLAGLAYAFNSWSRNELLRVHVLNVQWWPLAFLFLDRFLGGGRRRDAFALAGCLVLQGLSGTYYLVYTALALPGWLLIAWWTRRFGLVELRRLAAALVLAGLPALLILLPYALQLRSLGFEKELARGLDVLAYLEPARGNLAWGFLDLPARAEETEHFVGFLWLALVAAGLLRMRGGLDPRARLAAGLGAFAAALGFALSLGPDVSVAGRDLFAGPYRLLYDYVPFASGMASPERLSVLVVLGGAVLSGLGAAGLLARVRPERRALAVSVLAVLLPLEHWSAPRRAHAVPTGRDLPQVYRWLAQDSREPIVELPLFPDTARRRYFALYLNLSTHHWRPIPFGRTSFYPPAHDLLAWYLRGFPDASSIELLDRLGIRTIVVHPKAWTDESERSRRLAALRAEPRLALVGRFDDEPPARYADLHLGGELAYRIVGESGPLPAPCTPSDEIPREGWILATNTLLSPARLRDGDPRTAWATTRPQRPGDGVTVELARPGPLAAVAMDLASAYQEFPRELKLLVREGAAWDRVEYADGPAERWATIRDLVERPKQARLVLRFPPREATRLRLAIDGRVGDEAWPRWAVPELRLYRQCQ